MDKETIDAFQKEIEEYSKLMVAKIDNLHYAMDKRFESLKKIICDYLELSSQLSIATVKANLKNV
jgi:hypothetical protein